MKKVLLFLLLPIVTVSQTKEKDLLASINNIPYIVGTDFINGYPIQIRHLETNNNKKCPALYKFCAEKKKIIGWTLSNGIKETIIKDIKYEETTMNPTLIITGKEFNVFIKSDGAWLLKETPTQIVFMTTDKKIIYINKN